MYPNTIRNRKNRKRRGNGQNGKTGSPGNKDIFVRSEQLDRNLRSAFRAGRTTFPKHSQIPKKDITSVEFLRNDERMGTYQYRIWTVRQSGIIRPERKFGESRYIIAPDTPAQ